jgi:PAB-dependent poly(A)-specific ribonuclease subunit 3
LTNEKAIRSVKEWRRVDCGGVVSVLDAFTTRAFGDSSLIFVTNYHPLSKTMVEAHLTNTPRYGARAGGATPIPEQVLWSYIVQLASALRSIHAENLAAHCLDPSKVLLTSKNRVRLSACAILDVVQHDTPRSLPDLQAEDLIQFGRLILQLGTNTANLHPNLQVSIDQLSRSYTADLREAVVWLLTPAAPPTTKNINAFLSTITSHVMSSFDSSLHEADSLTSELSKELENGRLARLVMKLGVINERPEFDGDRHWAENGERYPLKLFRDYVFHQVDAEGNPVVDLGHIVKCLNKLDAGTEEKIMLTSRDEQTSFIVSYRELKKLVAGAFGDLVKTTGRKTY